MGLAGQQGLSDDSGMGLAGQQGLSDDCGMGLAGQQGLSGGKTWVVMVKGALGEKTQAELNPFLLLPEKKKQ
jgi:hypothetical protein